MVHSKTIISSSPFLEARGIIYRSLARTFTRRSQSLSRRSRTPHRCTSDYADVSGYATNLSWSVRPTIPKNSKQEPTLRTIFVAHPTNNSSRVNPRLIMRHVRSHEKRTIIPHEKTRHVEIISNLDNNDQFTRLGRPTQGNLAQFHIYDIRITRLKITIIDFINLGI